MRLFRDRGSKFRAKQLLLREVQAEEPVNERKRARDRPKRGRTTDAEMEDGNRCRQVNWQTGLSSGIVTEGKGGWPTGKRPIGRAEDPFQV